MTLAAVILFAAMIVGAFVELPPVRDGARRPHLKIKQHARVIRVLNWSK